MNMFGILFSYLKYMHTQYIRWIVLLSKISSSSSVSEFWVVASLNIAGFHCRRDTRKRLDDTSISFFFEVDSPDKLMDSNLSCNYQRSALGLVVDLKLSTVLQSSSL